MLQRIWERDTPKAAARRLPTLAHLGSATVLGTAGRGRSPMKLRGTSVVGQPRPLASALVGGLEWIPVAHFCRARVLGVLIRKAVALSAAA